MKKAICIFLILTVLCSLSACSVFSSGFGLVSNEQLLAMSDEDLLYTVTVAMNDRVYTPDDPEAGFADLNEVQKNVYALCVYTTEMDCGGLCQFFVNQQSASAQQLPQALEAVGAQAHLALYRDFLNTNSIDPADLSGFAVETTEDFAVQYARFPYEAYDEAYYALPALHELLVAYIRENIFKITL